MFDLEMINKIKEWGFAIEKDSDYGTYKLYHEDAIKIITFSNYLGDEFEEYLKDNDIELGFGQSDVEEFFFVEYGITVY